MAWVGDRLIVIGTRIRRSLILGGHDSIDEKDAGYKLKDEDASPSEQFRILNMTIILRINLYGDTSKFVVSSSTKCWFIYLTNLYTH